VDFLLARVGQSPFESRQDRVLLVEPRANDEGKSKLFPVSRVVALEKRDFHRRQLVQPRAGLFARRFRRQRPRQRGAAHQVGMGANQGKLHFFRRGVDGLAKRGVQVFGSGEWTPGGGCARDPRRLFKDGADHPDEFLRRQTIEIGHAETHFYRVISNDIFTIAAGIGTSDMKLLHHTYGKARVRVLKVLRSGPRHSIKELSVSVMLQGDFESSYTRGDNSLVIPTDTMKNTVQVLALEHLGTETEDFGVILAEHFVKTYPQAARADVRLSERAWQRISLDGKAAAHSFQEAGPAWSWALISCAARQTTVQSGVENLLILKSAQSGFEGFVMDKYTTLSETRDRIFATQLKAVWNYRGKPVSYSQTNARILEAMLGIFADTYSPSVQATLFQMGQAALRAAPEVEKIHLALPNKHCLPANLAPFGLENKNELFIPTDEPHGIIEGTVGRE
jgi:urate oxidase